MRDTRYRGVHSLLYYTILFTDNPTDNYAVYIPTRVYARCLTCHVRQSGARSDCAVGMIERLWLHPSGVATLAINLSVLL